MTRCLARSFLLRALAIGFTHPAPRHAVVLGRLGRGLDAAASVLDPAALGGPAAAVRAALRRLGDDELVAEYRRHFGNAGRGRFPPYETAYAEGGDPVPEVLELEEIAGLYRAGGLRLPSRPAERVDHVALECGFLQVLARREAYAEERGEDSLVRSIRTMEASFLRDHLAPFGMHLAATLAAEGGFFGALSGLLAATLRLEAAEHGLSLTADTLQLRRAVPEAEERNGGTAPPAARTSSEAEGGGP